RGLPRPPPFPYTTLFRSRAPTAPEGTRPQRVVHGDRVVPAVAAGFAGAPRRTTSCHRPARPAARDASRSRSAYAIERGRRPLAADRKSTRLNSSHVAISY